MLKFSLQNFLQSFESLFLIWHERLPIYVSLQLKTYVIVWGLAYDAKNTAKLTKNNLLQKLISYI